VGVALFIVDACRDNPFRDGAGRSVGGARGLVRVEAAEGTFVMYSAGVGQQALDRLPGGADRNPNSVYTRTLLPILKTPGLSLRDWHGHVKAATLGREGTARALNVANVKNDGSVFGGWASSSSRAFGLGAKISVQGDRIHVTTQQFSIVTLQKSGNDRLVGTFKLKNDKTYPITLVRQ
jgi:hypothetical protein